MSRDRAKLVIIYEDWMHDRLEKWSAMQVAWNLLRLPAVGSEIFFARADYARHLAGQLHNQATRPNWHFSARLFFSTPSLRARCNARSIGPALIMLRQSWPPDTFTVTNFGSFAC